MQIVTARSAADFLAMVPTLVGWRPEQSIVFVPFAGQRTFPSACRIDLPRRERRADHRAVVHAALGILSRIPGADRVAVVVYTDRTFVGERGIPHVDLGRTAVDGLRRAGFHVGLAACIAADGWGDYLEPEHRETGRPLDEITRSGTAAQVLAPPGDSLHVTEIPDAAPAARRSVAAALGIDGSGPPPESLRRVKELPRLELVRFALEEDDDPATIAVALEVFDVPALRDLAVLVAAFGEAVGERFVAVDDRLRAAQRAASLDAASLDAGSLDAGSLDAVGLDAGSPDAVGLDAGSLECPPAGPPPESARSMDEVAAAALAEGDGDAREISDLLLGSSARVPDRERLSRLIRRLRTLIAHAPDELRVGPLTMLGWALWACGAGSAAAAMVDAALRIEPGNGMVQLLRSWFATGAVPEWLFSRFEEGRSGA